MSDDIKKKIDELQQRWTAVSQKKAGLEGQLQAKKDELQNVVQEIRAAGYDPKNIAQERDQAKMELEAMVAKLDTELTEVETALSSFQK
jgi:septal ring factor EnvC (AmiA/AmiB activator)